MTARPLPVTLVLATFLTVLSLPSTAELQVMSLAGDGMVIQRDVAVPIWGAAAPQATVEVTLRGQTSRAEADATRAWRVELPAMEAGGPHQLVIASGGERLVFNDVLIGDVWVCSGQSNMEWVVADSKNGAQEIAAAGDAMIRHFKVPRSWAAEPEAWLTGGAWEITEPANVGSFSAVGFFFARELRHHVQEGRLVIKLDHVGSGLVARGSEPASLEGYVIAGADRRFVRGDATIDGDRIVAWSGLVPAPVAVRYAWADNPEGANLYNREGLPASPFRTDCW